MNLLTLEEALLMHYAILSELQTEKAEFGLVRPEGLQSAIAEPTFILWEADVYPDDAAKAAAIASSLITGSPFQDGNKRVGIATGCVWLMINGHAFEVSDDEIVEAALGVAAGEWDFERFVEWFAAHIIR